MADKDSAVEKAKRRAKSDERKAADAEALRRLRLIEKRERRGR